MVVGAMTVEADVVVIGSGPGGYVAALRAAKLGLDVIVVEEQKYVGGVCLNVGCIPSKAMIHASHIVHAKEEYASMGINVGDVQVDFAKMQEWKKGITDKLNQGIRGLFDKYGVEVIEGRGTFTSSNEIHISGQSDVTAINFKNAIIATGSSVMEIPGFSFENPNVISSTGALELESIPEKMVVIGGGYIGTELGTVFGKLGSEIHILEMMDRLLPIIDKDLVDVVAKKLSSFNVNVHLKTKAEGFEERDGKMFVNIDEDGNKSQIEADKVLVVVGRVPNSKDLGLDKTKVEVDDHGFIKVDNQMRTADQNIFAIGDVVGQPMLAHKASREAKVAAEVIAGQPSSFDNKVIPYVVFNDPEIAGAGLTEQEAQEKGLEVNVGKFPFAALGRALTLNQPEGFVKLVTRKDNNTIVGCQIVGPGASDLVGEAALAIEMGATAEDLELTIHPHPTLVESLMEAAEVVTDTSVHIFSPKKKSE